MDHFIWFSFNSMEKKNEGSKQRVNELMKMKKLTSRINGWEKKGRTKKREGEENEMNKTAEQNGETAVEFLHTSHINS